MAIILGKSNRQNKTVTKGKKLLSSNETFNVGTTLPGE